MKYIEDILALSGIGAVGAGVGLRFGWDWSLIVVGSLLLGVAVTSALKGGSDASK